MKEVVKEVSASKSDLWDWRLTYVQQHYAYSSVPEPKLVVSILLERDVKPFEPTRFNHGKLVRLSGRNEDEAINVMPMIVYRESRVMECADSELDIERRVEGLLRARQPRVASL